MVPVIVKLKLPHAKASGAMLTMPGVGSRNLIFALPDVAGVVPVAAVSVIELVLGIAAGAVYTPLAVTVPTLLSPPAIPLTVHVNPVAAFPLSFATKVCLLLIATVSLAGLMVKVSACALAKKDNAQSVASSQFLFVNMLVSKISIAFNVRSSYCSKVCVLILAQ